MPEETLSFEKQLELHAPFLSQRVVTFFEEVDMLGFVHSQQDPSSKIVDRIIVEDKLIALGGAYKQVKQSKGLRDSVEILESVDGEVDERTVARLGRLLLKDSEEIDVSLPEADDAVRWAIEVLGDKKNLKAFHKLFDKKLEKDGRTKSPLTEKPRAPRAKPKRPSTEKVHKVATKEKKQTHHIRLDTSAALVDPDTDIRSIRERHRSAIRGSRNLNNFDNSLRSYIDGRIASGDVRLSEVSQQVAAILEIDINDAEAAVLNVVASSEDMHVNRIDGSRKIGPTNKSVAKLLDTDTASQNPLAEIEYPLHIDDFDIVQDILTVVADKQYVNQGSTSREIELALLAKDYDIDVSRVKALIRTVCDVSGKTVFKITGNYGRSRKGPQLFFASTEDRKTFREDPVGFTEEIFEKVLYDNTVDS